MLHKLHLFSFLQIFHWESTNNLCCAKILDFPTNLLELWILCQAKDMLPDVVRGLCHHLWVALILVCISLLSLCKSLLQKRFEMCNNRYLFTSLSTSIPVRHYLFLFSISFFSTQRVLVLGDRIIWKFWEMGFCTMQQVFKGVELHFCSFFAVIR